MSMRQEGVRDMRLIVEDRREEGQMALQGCGLES